MSLRDNGPDGRDDDSGGSGVSGSSEPGPESVGSVGGLGRPGALQRTIREIRDLALFALALFLTVHSVAQAYNVPTGSMEDTILVGDYLWAGKFVYGAPVPFTHLRLPALRDPRRDEIVVFKFPGDGKTDYVKRCVGIPGDTLEIKGGRLFVNGDRTPDPKHGKHDVRSRAGGRLSPRGRGTDGSRDDFGPFVVPPDHYFMMGDNRDNSYDSRAFGPVPRDLIVAKALFLYMSWDPECHPAPSVSPDEPASYLRRAWHNLRYAPTKVRWSRIGDSLM
jgi:signal peptidase I